MAAGRPQPMMLLPTVASHSQRPRKAWQLPVGYACLPCNHGCAVASISGMDLTAFRAGTGLQLEPFVGVCRIQVKEVM
jgi:hypothetical protein